MNALPEHTPYEQYPTKRPSYREPIIDFKPDPVCQCGCGKTIEVIELRTHEGEPVYSEACFLKIAYQEKWLIKEAV